MCQGNSLQLNVMCDPGLNPEPEELFSSFSIKEIVEKIDEI